MSNGTTTIDPDEKRVEFLKYAITYIENRIRLIDHKASLLIAIETALLILGTFALKWLFGENKLEMGIIPCLIVMTLFLFLVLTVLSLIMAIKSTECFFSLRVEIPQVHINRQILFPTDDFPDSGQDYKVIVNELEWPDDYIENYGRTHFVLSRLLRKKYRYYDIAILLMKISWCLTAVAIAIALRLKICGS